VDHGDLGIWSPPTKNLPSSFFSPLSLKQGPQRPVLHLFWPSTYSSISPDTHQKCRRSQQNEGGGFLCSYFYVSFAHTFHPLQKHSIGFIILLTRLFKVSHRNIACRIMQISRSQSSRWGESLRTATTGLEAHA